jgi:hypothetical protein
VAAISINDIAAPKPDIVDFELTLSVRYAQPLRVERSVKATEHRKPIHHPGSLIIHAASIWPMRNAAHATATRGPKPHKAMPGLRNH